MTKVQNVLSNTKQKGFTIVELLIVVVIIGILAAIVVVAYNGITSRAHSSAIESDLATIAKKLEVYKAEEGSYPASGSELDDADLKVTKGSYMVRNNLYYCRSNDGQHYAIGAYTLSDIRYWLVDGIISTTTDNIYGSATCDKLNPYAHPTYAHVGYDHDGGTGWQSWTQ